MYIVNKILLNKISRKCYKVNSQEIQKRIRFLKASATAKSETRNMEKEDQHVQQMFF